MKFYCSIRISHVFLHFFQKEDNLFRKYKTQAIKINMTLDTSLILHTYRCYFAFVRNPTETIYYNTTTSLVCQSEKFTSHSEGQKLSVGGWNRNQSLAELRMRQPWKLSSMARELGSGAAGTDSQDSWGHLPDPQNKHYIDTVWTGSAAAPPLYRDGSWTYQPQKCSAFPIWGLFCFVFPLQTSQEATSFLGHLFYPPWVDTGNI